MISSTATRASPVVTAGFSTSVVVNIADVFLEDIFGFSDGRVDNKLFKNILDVEMVILLNKRTNVPHLYI